MLAVNQILQDRYQITRHLGHGGMGTVYEAKDLRLGSLVALKQILFELDDANKARQQELSRLAFEREAKILANLQHEAFPRVTDYFTENDRQFLIMELIRGDDLGELLRKRGTPFLLEDVLVWADQLLDAVDYLHNQVTPIIHRDIKPQNLKLTDRGRIVLLDFGIAKGVEPKTHGTVSSQSFLAVTLHYSPIEQIFRVMDTTFRDVIENGHGDKFKNVYKQSIDVRSDLYALGATLYHLLTGRLPTDSLKRTLEVWSGKSDVLPVPNVVNPEIPVEISTFLLKAMAIENRDRFVSARQMRNALRRAVKDVRQRESDARKAVYWTEQMRIENDRQSEAEKHLKFETEERKRTGEHPDKAGTRRKKAEGRPLELDPESVKLKKSSIQSEIRTPKVEFLQFVQEKAGSDDEETATDGNFELLKIEMFPPERNDKHPFPAGHPISLGTTDSLSEFNGSSYQAESKPQNEEQETILRAPSPIRITENGASSYFRNFRVSRAAGLFLTGVLIILTILFFQNHFSGYLSSRSENSRIPDLKPSGTDAPVITSTTEPTATPAVETFNTPSESTPPVDSIQSKTRITRPPKTAKANKTKPKTRTIKNFDCIFNDDCK